MNTSEHVETMLMRVRTLLSDTRMKTITEVSDDLTLEKWLEEYICPSDSVEGAIIVRFDKFYYIYASAHIAL